jgi:hypothetical protein
LPALCPLTSGHVLASIHEFSPHTDDHVLNFACNAVDIAAATA